MDEDRNAPLILAIVILLVAMVFGLYFVKNPTQFGFVTTEDYNALVSDYNELLTNYKDLVSDYNEMVNNHNWLAKYGLK